MPEKSKNPFKFWEELKRRKVFRVSIGYLASAYVLLEFISIIAEPFRLPEWTIRFVFILLCIGFVIIVLLSWIYDFTSEGIKKTEPYKDAESLKPVPRSGKWKIKGSDIVIAVLLVIVVILAFPKVFRTKSDGDLSSMTVPVNYINEFGQEETRQVFKMEYIHKILILPFESDPLDSLNFWLKYGIYQGIREKLNQFPYIDARGMESDHLQEIINEAQANNYPYFLTGTYEITDGQYTIHTQIHIAKNGTVTQNRVFQGTDLFTIFDSIGVQIRIDLGIQKELIDAYTDLPFREYITGNIRAYKYYIQGVYINELGPGSSYYYYDKALQTDTTFALAALRYAHSCIYNQVSNYSARKYIDQAMRHRQRLTDYYNIFVQKDQYRIYDDFDMAIALSELQCELHPYDPGLLRQLIDIYYAASKTTNVEKALIKLNELVPDDPAYQVMLARNYLISNDIKKGLKYTEARIAEHPDNAGLLFKKGQFHLQEGDLDKAEEVFQKVILLSPENKKVFSLIMDHITFLEGNTSESNNLRKFTGRYRTDNSEYYNDILLRSDHLVRDGPNMVGSIYYPLSDTSLVDFIGSAQNSLGSQSSRFVIDERGKVIRFLDYQSNRNYPVTYWRQDSLILHALKLFESGRDQEVLSAFRRAYSENPEHYYLANYIKHLEFILSNNYIKSKPVLESCMGEYISHGIYMEDDKFYMNRGGLYFEILPMSENQFMNPSQYYYTIQFIKEGNHISGLQVQDIVGNEYYYKKRN